MLSTELRGPVDRVWDAVWSHGITNPMIVSDLLGTVLMASVPQHRADWNALAKATEQGASEEVAATLARVRRAYGIDPGSELESAGFWRDTRALEQAMHGLEFVHERTLGTDVLGDIYEHMLAKLSLAGQFGQFRTPRHLVEFMVELAAPAAGETVVDPACGSGGFLVAASDYRRRRGLAGAVVGHEIDRTVSRIAEANLAFHAVEGGRVTNDDGLADRGQDAQLILANPPFSGSVSDAVAAGFPVRTKKTELLFLQAMMSRLVPGGRAAVVVPTGVLTGMSAAARAVRERLVTSNRLRAVIELPAGVFRPYTDIKTAILVWEAGATPGSTLMVRVDHDGFTLDQRRLPIEQNDLPAVLDLWEGRVSPVASARVDVDGVAPSGFLLNPSRFVAARTRSSSRADAEGGVRDSESATADVPTALADLASRARAIQERIAALRAEERR